MKANLVDPGHIKKLIIAALPNYVDYLDQVGADGYYFALEALETQLVKEIDLMLSGAKSDQASIDQASKIVKYSNEVLKEASKEQTPKA